MRSPENRGGITEHSVCPAVLVGMGNLWVMIVSVFLTVLAGTVFGISDSVGRGTSPASSGRSGLIRSRNPIDRSGNLVITGNVGGGKHFRGVVPYRAPFEFGDRLGSTAIDPFLRRYSGVGEVIRSNRPAPYLSLSGTVSKGLPGGRGGIIRAPQARIRNRARSQYALPGIPAQDVLPKPGSALSTLRYRPISPKVREMEKGLPLELQQEVSEELTRLHAERRERLTEQFRQDLTKATERVAELRQELSGEKLSLRESANSDITEYLPVVDQAEVAELYQQQAMKDKEPDIYEQMKQSIFGDEEGEGLETEAEESYEVAKRDSEAADEKSQAEKMGEVIMAAAGTKAFMGEHKTFAAVANDRFNRHMLVAEEYMRAGRYYRAADAYALASTYKPEDPLAYAGKSHALFAAGSYMSSALFLARTLEMFPEYAQFKIDLVAMVGDRDKLESRLVDIEERYERNGAAELKFLSAYVYYHIGRIDKAREAIDIAGEAMSDEPAVLTLKDAIHSAEK